MTAPAITTKYAFRRQGKHADCFAVAVMNACIYKGMPVPNRYQLRKIGAGLDGGIVRYAACLKAAGLRYQKLDFKKPSEMYSMLKHCGIMTIMHPIYNLHAIFCFKQNDKIYIVNSLLGNNVIDVHGTTLWNLQAAHSHNRMAYRIRR